jgi:hypothetical protein
MKKVNVVAKNIVNSLSRLAVGGWRLAVGGWRFESVLFKK